MKRLNAALILCFLILPLCFAQTQTGNASYNQAKPGFYIDHPSLSFATRVKVTNLRNNLSVNALVNGRIPSNTEKIADIYRDAGDALKMNKNGMTLVLIEELPRETTPAAPVEAARDTEPAPPPVVPVQPAQPAPQPSGSSQPAPPSAVTQILPLQTVTEYVQVPAQPAQPCCSAPLLLAILLLLILAIILLAVILALMLRRFPLWPWYYPLWLRRRYKSAKKRFKKPM